MPRRTVSTCPSGATVRHSRNTQGQIVGAYARPTANAAEVVLADTVGYLPFGSLQTLRYGNGRTLTRTYDQNYAIDRIEDDATDGLALDFTPDIAGILSDSANSRKIRPSPARSTTTARTD